MTMTGSEKQIKWAQDLKSQWTEKITEWVFEAAEHDGASAEERDAMLAEVLRVIKGQTKAKWWIDSRTDIGQRPWRDAGEMLEHIAKHARAGFGRDGKLDHNLPF